MKHPFNSPARLSSSLLGRCLMLAAFLLLGWTVAPAASNAGTGQQDIQPLEVGRPVEKTLAGGQTHNYSVALLAGQFLHLVIEQRGIDVAVKLFGPDSKELLLIDSPNGDQGPEPLFWVAEAAGNYRIEVGSGDKQAPAGRYEARVAALRPATESDKTRVAASRAMAEAESLAEKTDAATRERRSQKYEEALGLWRQINDQPGVAAALTALGDVRRLANQLQQAIEPYQQAIPLWHALRDQFNEGEVLHKLGTTYNDLGQARTALGYLNQALPIWRATKDREHEAYTLNVLGIAHSNLGEKRRAVDILEQALKLWRALGNRVQEAQTLTNLGNVYSNLSEQQRALGAYAQALPLRRDPRGRAVTLYNIGRSYDLLGASQEALNYYNQALPLLRTADDKRNEAITLSFMGLSYWALGDYQRALDALNQSLPLRREVQDRNGEAATFNNIGLVYDTLGDRQKALEAYNQAKPIWDTTGNRQGSAYTLNNLGFAYDALGDKPRARENHQRALELSREVGDRQREAKVRYGLARIASQDNQLKQARQQIEGTIKIVESLRQKLASPDLRAQYRASVQQYYDLYIDLLMRMGKRLPRGIAQNKLVAEALQVSERARARSLVELLTEANADIRQGVDIKLVERERELQEQINDKTTEQIRLLGTRAKTELIAAAGKEIEQLNADLRDVQSQIRATSPRYASLTQPQPLAARDIQRLLDANTMLLEFSLGEERSYLWAATPTAIYSYTLPKRAEIEAAAKRFYDLATARNQYVAKESNQQKQERVAQADKDSLAAAAALGRMLLAPVAPLLGNKRLVIVADGALQYVPFGALTIRNPQSQIRNPLVASHEMISLPSASTLAALRGESAQRTKASKTVAVIADPVFEVKDERVKVVTIKADPAKPAGKDDKPAAPAAPAGQNIAEEPSRILLYKSAKDSGVTDAEFRIPRLPNTRREAETILSLAGGNTGKATFDFAASRAAATSDDLGQYRILHFATHGFLNSLNPELSGLVLSMVDEQGKPQNGYLLAPEIYNLKLPATELVVLSACQTGLGKEIRGEGVVGLTRGFMYAGAPRVVVSLWSVNDRSTADLMKHFYEAMLSKGQRPSAALRSAQLELMKLKAWQAPYYWAAFGLQGEWR